MWLHIPESFISSPSAPESGCSITESSWQFRMLEQSAMLKSKLSPSRSWYRAWKTNAWMKRLFGRIVEPSMADRGAAKWIASLGDTHASRLACLDEDRAQTILATFGLTSSGSSPRPDPLTCSSKTLRDILHLDSMKSKQAWKALVTGWRQDFSARKRLALRSAEIDSSYWRNPQASDGEGGVMEIRPEANAHYKLRDQAAQWATTQARDWKGYSGLQNQKDLSREAMKWATTTTRDWKDGAMANANVPTNSLLGRQVLRTSWDGDASWKKGYRLNPRFSEWLMGWMPGWTHPSMPIGLNDFELLGMVWLRLLRRLLSLYFPEG